MRVLTAGAAISASPPAVVSRRGSEHDVTFVEAEVDAHPAVDAAYNAKYDRYGPNIVGNSSGRTPKP